MSTRLVLSLAAAILVAGGAFYVFSRAPGSGNGRSATSEGSQPRGPKQAGPEALTPTAPERVDAARADQRTTTTRESQPERVDQAAPPREVTETEKESVRELIKLARGTKENSGGESTSLDATVPGGFDGDSLFLKYGSLNKAQCQEALASLRAILLWQDQGPLENKELDLLPLGLRRGFDIELEWLEQHIQGM